MALASTPPLVPCCGVLFGLAPALRLSGLDLHCSLKDGARASAGSGNGLRRLLVVSNWASRWC
jgi:hypothetical protein